MGGIARDLSLRGLSFLLKEKKRLCGWREWCQQRDDPWRHSLSCAQDPAVTEISMPADLHIQRINTPHLLFAFRSSFPCWVESGCRTPPSPRRPPLRRGGLSSGLRMPYQPPERRAASSRRPPTRCATASSPACGRSLSSCHHRRVGHRSQRLCAANALSPQANEQAIHRYRGGGIATRWSGADARGRGAAQGAYRLRAGESRTQRGWPVGGEDRRARRCRGEAAAGQGRASDAGPSPLQLRDHR